MKLARVLLMICVLCALYGCRRFTPKPIDHPFIAPGAVIKDVSFHSVALNRDMPYRVFLPANMRPGDTLPVVYLLHGGNGSFRDWSNDSVVSRYVSNGLILVMPEGEFSYYMNAAEKPANRFEDYIFSDLISDVESRFPAAKSRNKRAVIGISMGGFAAIKIALTRPDLFAFVAAFSPSIDITHRRFNLRRWGEWWRIRTIFGPMGSAARRSRDPMTILASADARKAPYLYITAGQNEPLLVPDRAFAERLSAYHFEHEFHTQPGGHDWNEWNRQLPGCFDSLLRHLSM